MQTIFLDHASTTPILPEVAEAIHACHREGLGNPSSAHALGRRARTRLEDAREGMAEILGLDLGARPADRLILTSGGTEANNLALAGLVPGGRGARIAVSAMEHPSVRVAAERRAAAGDDVVWLPVTPDGLLDLSAAAELLERPTALVSVQACNHETGVVQPLEPLAALCRSKGILLHTDAAQAVGKLPVDFRAAQVDALSVAAHKFQGPVGIGALAVRGGVTLRPLFVGGSQQLGERAGTENVALAVGMHEALKIWQRSADARRAHLQSLQARFEESLRAAAPDLVIHGDRAPRAPHLSMVAFPGLQREALLVALDLRGVACSAGSACASGSSGPSPTLRAMGLAEPLWRSSLRFSWGATTTLDELTEAVSRISHVLSGLRSGNTGVLPPGTHRVSEANSLY